MPKYLQIFFLEARFNRFPCVLINLNIPFAIYLSKWFFDMRLEVYAELGIESN